MSNIVDNIWDQTKSLAKDNDRISEVIKLASEKARNFTAQENAKGKLAEMIKMVSRMIKAQLSGDYGAFSNKTIFLLVFGLLYFVIPTDLLPDFIPVLGFSDDLTVLYYVTTSISEDIDAFKQWESES